MINPGQDDIGSAVIYRSRHDVPPEDGVITSYNSEYVFVRYKGDLYGKATHREDLYWPHNNMVDNP